MAINITQDFEAGPNGAALTTANSGATAVNGGTLIPVFDNAQARQGTYSVLFNTTANTSILRYDVTATSLEWVDYYVYLTANPAASVYVAQWNNGVTKVGDLRINTDGTMTIRDNITAVATSTVSLTLNSWNRFSFKAQPGSSTGHALKLYVGANRDGTTADYSGTGAATSAAQTALDSIRVGVMTASTFSYRIDRLRGDDTAEPTGMPAAAPPTVNAGPDLTVDTGSANFSITGTATAASPAAIASVVWAYVSGPTVTLTGTSTNTVTVTPPTSPGTLVLSFSATDNNSTPLTSTDTVSITFVSPGRKIYPTADVTVTGLTAKPTVTPMALNLDESPASNTDRVLQPVPNGSESRFRISPASPPASNNNVVLNVWMWVNGAASQSTRVRVYDSDGTTVRAERTYTDLPSYTEAVVDGGMSQAQTDASLRQVVLTAGEAAAITGWTSGIIVGWAPTAS